MTSIVRSLIPPVVFQAKRALMPPRPIQAYGSYYEALQHCGQGYNDHKLADVLVRKTQAYRAELQDTPVVVSDARWIRLALAIRTAAQNGTLNCLDFGGAAGTDYLLAKHIFGDKIKLRWHVVETPALAARANEGMANDELRFYDDLDGAVNAFDGSVDLLLSSGALQYAPEPLRALSRLCEVGAMNLFLTRTALADAPLPARTIVQKSLLSNNGPCALPEGVADEVMSFPATFADRLEAENILAQRYRIDMRFNEDRGAYTIGDQPISMYGYLASLTGTQSQTCL